MADLVTFSLRDATGAALTGVTPMFLAYVSRAAAAQAQPAIVDLGNGQYGFVPTDAATALGVLGVIDGTAAASPRYQAVQSSADSDPFQAVLATDDAGALFAGAGLPVITTYKDPTGANRAAPSVLVAVGNHLFCFTPTAADLVVDVAWTLTAQAGANLGVDSGEFHGAAAASSTPSTPSDPSVTTGEDIRAQLVADVTVASLVAGRIYPNRAPDKAAAPFIVYQVISDVPENTLTGAVADRLTNTRLQLDCYAKTYRAAHAVAGAADSVVSGLSTPDLSAWRIGKRDLFDDETQLHRVSSDYSVYR